MERARLMATVRKRILPRTGETRWQVDYRDQGGKRRSKQFATKREADSYETKVRGEVAAGVHVADSASVTVAQAVQLWVDSSRSDGLQASTVKQYDEHRRLHIVPLLGHVMLSQLNTPRCEAFKDELLKTRSRALSRAVLTSLKSAIDEGRRRGLIAMNPAEVIKINRRRSEDDDAEKIVIPSKDQIRALLMKAPEIWPLVRTATARSGEQKLVAVPWQPMVVVAIFTGMRQSELRGLTWPHVDLKAGTIRVRQRADRWGVIGPVKSSSSRRDIPMAPSVARVLRGGNWPVDPLISTSSFRASADRCFCKPMC
jgi:integrase